MRKAVLLLLVLCTGTALRATETVSSPNGRLTVSVDAGQGMAHYSVLYDGRQL